MMDKTWAQYPLRKMKANPAADPANGSETHFNDHYYHSQCDYFRCKPVKILEKDTIKKASEWLAQQIRKNTRGYSYQEHLVHDIEEKYGEESVYLNDNGNLAINRKILTAFRKISPDIVYVNNESAWRLKTKNDTSRTVND